MDAASRRVKWILLALLLWHEDAAACEQLDLWDGGRVVGHLCPDELGAAGATAIDLGETWVPTAIAQSGTSYRPWFEALAREDFASAGPDAELAPTDRYFELFGIPPTFEVIRRRLDDDARHACHAAAPLPASRERLVEESASASPSKRRPARVAAVRAVQAHLACDQLLDFRPVPGIYSWQTSNAVERFQRGAMILPTGIVDAETWAALELDSRERDASAALRVLRERIVAATGLIEDGSAGAAASTVLGRILGPTGEWQTRGHAPLPDAAPDLISRATEVAAIALGWHDADSIRAFLDAGHARGRVAIRLPSAPAYHTAAMPLSIEIDRGDVSRARGFVPPRRPVLVVYAGDGERRIPLVRWPTTIGGWQDENVDGAIVRRWKESPVGAREWRDLFVAPRWLPPLSTPDRELVRQGDRGPVLATQELGPSYRAAFGLAAFVHLNSCEDEGIRTHGTGNLASLARGSSHGCHRMLGLHVIRLAGFVLAHHGFAVHGPAPAHYRRTVRARGRSFQIAIDTTGDRIELVPPIPVAVRP